MTNNKIRLNAIKTDLIILGTSRQRNKFTHIFPTNIFHHSITPGSIDLIKALPAKAVESQRLVFCHLFKIYYIGDEVVRNK